MDNPLPASPPMQRFIKIAGIDHAQSLTRTEVIEDLSNQCIEEIRKKLPTDTQRKIGQEEDARRRALEIIQGVVQQEHKNYLANPALGDFPDGESEAIALTIYQAIYSLGPIDNLLEHDEIEDIAVNGPNEICYRTPEGWRRVDDILMQGMSRDPQAELNRFNRAIAELGIMAGPQNPIVSARLPKGGHRISIVTAPVSRDFWPCVVIRKHRPRSFTLENFVSAPQKAKDMQLIRQELKDLTAIWHKDAIFTPAVAAFFQMAIAAGLNILVLGRTGVGKTAFLSMLGSLIPPDRRVLVIEDTRELNLRAGDVPNNCVYYTTVRSQAEGGINVEMHELVKMALRQRPDHLVLGEARGPEMWDLLNAMMTGHDGNLTSLHALDEKEVVKRAQYMIRLPPAEIDLSLRQVSELVASTFHIFVTYLMPANGRRHIARISALTGEVGTDDRPILETVFQGGADNAHILELNASPTALERHFNRVGFGFSEVIKLEQKRKELGAS